MDSIGPAVAEDIAHGPCSGNPKESMVADRHRTGYEHGNGEDTIVQDYGIGGIARRECSGRIVENEARRRRPATPPRNEAAA